MRSKFSRHLKKPWMSFTVIYILLLSQALGQLPESTQPKLNVGSWIKSLFTLPSAYAQSFWQHPFTSPPTSGTDSQEEGEDAHDHETCDIDDPDCDVETPPPAGDADGHDDHVHDNDNGDGTEGVQRRAAAEDQELNRQAEDPQQPQTEGDHGLEGHDHDNEDPEDRAPAAAQEPVKIDVVFEATEFRQQVVQPILLNQKENNANSKIPERQSAVVSTTQNLLVTYLRALETKYEESNWFKVNFNVQSQVSNDFWKLKLTGHEAMGQWLSDNVNDEAKRRAAPLILQLQTLLYKKCITKYSERQEDCEVFAKDAKNLPYPFKDTGEDEQHAYHNHVLQGVYTYEGIQAWINDDESFRAYQFLFRPFMCMAMDEQDIAAYYYGYGLPIDIEFTGDETPHPFPGINGGCADNQNFSADQSFPEKIVVSKIPMLKLQATDEAALSAASSLAVLQTLRLKQRNTPVADRMDIFRLPLTQGGLVKEPLQLTTSFFVEDKKKGTKDIRYVDIVSFFANYFLFMQKGDLTGFDNSTYEEFAISVFGDSPPSMPALETDEVAALKRIFGITDDDASTVFNKFKVGEGSSELVDLGKYLNSVNQNTLKEMFLPIFMLYMAYTSGKTISGLDSLSINDLAAFKLLLGSPDSEYPPLFFDATNNKILSPLEAIKILSDFYVGQDKGSLKRIIMLPPLFNAAIQHDLGLPTKGLFPGPTSKQQLQDLSGGQSFLLPDKDVFIAQNFSSVTGRTTKAALEATTLAALVVLDEQCRSNPEYAAVMSRTEECVRDKLKTRQDIQERAIPIGAYGSTQRPRLAAQPAPTTEAQRLQIPTMPSASLVRSCSSPDGSESGIRPSAAFNFAAEGDQSQLNMCMLYASIITHFDEQFQKQAPCYDKMGWHPIADCAWSSTESVLWQIFVIIMALALLLQAITLIFVGDFWFWEGELWRCLTKGQCKEWLEKDKARQARRAEERAKALEKANKLVNDAIMQRKNRSSISPFAQPIISDVLQRQPSGSPPPSSGPSPTPTTPDFSNFDIRFGTPL